MGFAAIYIPEFPSLAWLRNYGQARSHAIAVIEGNAPLEKVISLNRAAKRLGIEHGMSKVQADISGKVLFHPRSLPEEQEALLDVCKIAEAFSPRVQIMASPTNRYANSQQMAAVLLVDQSGTERLFGEAHHFAGKLRDALREAAFPANVAVAPNAEAGLLLARSYVGVTVVDEHTVQAKLASLPLSVLRSESSSLAVLRRWGIRNLGELAALPTAALVSRVGQQGKRLQRLALGTEDHLFIPQEPDFALSEHVALDSPLESLDSLLFLISPMLDRILRRAIQHAYALRRVAIQLELEKYAPHTLEVRPAVPAQHRDLLLKLLNMELQAKPPQAGILGLTLSAEPAVPQVAQRGLFQAQFLEPDKLDLLVARLKSIVGHANVGSPALSNSHRDDEFTIRPFQPIAGTQGTALPEPGTIRVALRRLRPPQPVKLVFSGTVPSHLFWDGERLRVEGVTGPWQSSGYWWDGRRWEADEWDVIVTQFQQALRLRHETGPNTWYVVGQYD